MSGNITEELVSWDDGSGPIFAVEYEDPAKNEFATFTFTVYEVIGESKEKYLSGFIKFDGCCHFNFGDKNGYLHLCGRQGIENLHDVIEGLWELAERVGVL